MRNNNNNNNKDFGTRTAPEVRFPTPHSFSLRNPQRRSFGKNMGGGPQTKYFSRCLNLGGRRACFSDELRLRSACPLGCWLQNPPERTEGTNRKIKKMLRMRRKTGERATRGPKAGARLTKMNIQKLQKLQNASIACGPTAVVLGKRATRGPKIEAELAAVIISNFQKRKIT